ncbi:hypothetical protein GCM10027282_12760 [Frigoribacterium salinisoli]
MIPTEGVSSEWTGPSVEDGPKNARSYDVFRAAQGGVARRAPSMTSRAYLPACRTTGLWVLSPFRMAAWPPGRLAAWGPGGACDPLVGPCETPPQLVM